MVHGYAGMPWKAGLVAGIGGGINTYMGRKMPAGGGEGGSGFNPAVLAPAAMALLGALRGGRGLAAAGKPHSMPGTGSGLQTEGMGYAAY